MELNVRVDAVVNSLLTCDNDIVVDLRQVEERLNVLPEVIDAPPRPAHGVNEH